MKWHVEFHDEFYSEFLNLGLDIREEMLVKVKILNEFGPQLGRPCVVTLNDSEYGNMKELRFTAGEEVWRVAFAFDPARSAILLIGEDQRGEDQKQLYINLIRCTSIKRKIPILSDLQ